MPLSLPELEQIRQRDPITAEALHKLATLIAPTQVNTSGKGNPNGVISASVNTIFVQTDDSTGQSQWIKTGKSGDSSGWVKLSTSANQIINEVPVDTGDHKNYNLANVAVPNTLQLFVNGLRSSLAFTVSGKRLSFAVANSPTDKLLVDYVKKVGV